MNPIHAGLRWRPLGPAVNLMRRLRMPVKLATMVLMLAVPLLLLVVNTTASRLQELQFVRSELDGAQQASRLLDLVLAVQTHRDTVLRASAGDAGARQALPAAAQALREAVAQADPPPQGLRFAPPEDWPATREAIARLTEDTAGLRRDELAARHQAQVDALRGQLLLVGERSGLLLDPEAASYFLMDVAIERMVPWLEALSNLRGQGAMLLARGDASARERSRLVSLASETSRHLKDVAFRMAALQRTGLPEPAAWAPARDASSALAIETDKRFTAEMLEGDAQAFHREADEAFNRVKALKAEVVAQLIGALSTREAAAQRALVIELGSAALGFALLLYLSAAFFVSFQGALHALHKGVRAVADGDLSQALAIKGQDELADMGRLLETMNARLSSMVAEIRSSAVRVGMSGNQVAHASQSLAIRTDTQAASLRQTVETVGHLSDAVANNAAAARDLDQLTERLRSQAEAGGSAMRDAVQAMGGLEDSAERMAEIIGVIDGIAFQTNILALSAAGEAARAGEAGRGFAVVAAEVRQLAQRSSTASAEIRSLIARSTEQVGASVTQTRQVGQTLDQVVDGVRRVSDALRAIAQASARQSTDLEEVSKSVGSLDEITRDNASMVVDSSVASQELVERAEALSGAVASIRLRQGSADEAHALVDRALGLIKQVGYQAALERLHSREEGFVDRDLYVFVIDRRGHYRVHGARPAMEGKLVHEVPGIDGDRFVRDAWEAAPLGGWVEYDIVNPESGVVQPKASYVKVLDEHLLVGCGVYRHGSTAARPQARAAAPA